MKTIKIIDLLNMIANKEYDKLPKKIKYNNIIYWLANDFNNRIGFYLTRKCDTLDSNFFLGNLHSTSELLDEVEIVEDNKIEKMGFAYVNLYGNKSIHKKSEEDIINKINEIIDVLNEMRNKNENK